MQYWWRWWGECRLKRDLWYAVLAGGGGRGIVGGGGCSTVGCGSSVGGCM